jgi:hypothetical protein
VCDQAQARLFVEPENGKALAGRILELSQNPDTLR